MHAYTRSMDTWLRIEAGQLDRAAVVAADMINAAERHGFDMWPLVGVTWQAAVGALAALHANDLDQTALTVHIATTTTFFDNSAHNREHLHHRLRRHPCAAGWCAAPRPWPRRRPVATRE